jgi:hypothetical protein
VKLLDLVPEVPLAEDEAIGRDAMLVQGVLEVVGLYLQSLDVVATTVTVTDIRFIITG